MELTNFLCFRNEVTHRFNMHYRNLGDNTSLSLLRFCKQTAKQWHSVLRKEVIKWPIVCLVIIESKCSACRLVGWLVGWSAVTVSRNTSPIKCPWHALSNITGLSCGTISSYQTITLDATSTLKELICNRRFFFVFLVSFWRARQ